MTKYKKSYIININRSIKFKKEEKMKIISPTEFQEKLTSGYKRFYNTIITGSIRIENKKVKDIILSDVEIKGSFEIENIDLDNFCLCNVNIRGIMVLRNILVKCILDIRKTQADSIKFSEVNVQQRSLLSQIKISSFLDIVESRFHAFNLKEIKVTEEDLARKTFSKGIGQEKIKDCYMLRIQRLMFYGKEILIKYSPSPQKCTRFKIVTG